MRQIKQNNKQFILAVFAALFIIVLLIGGGAFARTTAFAASESYTDVLDDLSVDPEFDIEKYSVNAGDYSLQVIQIAESSDEELLIYVYQPSAYERELTATSINISVTLGDSLQYHNYKLELLNKNDVFHKYRVQNFELRKDMLRYYDISSIFRKWDENLDKDLPAQNENNISEVAFEVGQWWTACTVNGEVYYSMETTETIEITDKYVGYIRYESTYIPPWLTAGTMIWASEYYDNHYIAFDTDFPIDRLIEADVYYISRSYSYNIATLLPSYGEMKENEVHLTEIDTCSVETVSGALWQNRNSYTWNRIQTVEEFKAENDLTVEEEVDLLGKKWVLHFCETETKNTIIAGLFFIESTLISDVTILRLKFETDGVVYNLGVVDNKQSEAPDQAPGNKQEDYTILDDVKDTFDTIKDFFENVIKFFQGLPWWGWLVTVGCVIVAVIVVILIIKCVLGYPFRKLKERRELRRWEKAQAKREKYR